MSVPSVDLLMQVADIRFVKAQVKAILAECRKFAPHVEDQAIGVALN